MRLTLVSTLVFFAVLPAFASAKLPTVNIGGTGVSARSAFGDNESLRGAVKTAPAKRVVARTARNTDAVAKHRDTFVDVLSPNLPSSNLWAENKNTENTGVNAPLRMPRMDEFAVFNSNDFDLPDEDINIDYVAKQETPVSDNQIANDLEDTMNRMAEIDAKIARLSELQRRANDSVKQRVVGRASVEKKDSDVKLSRTVVPMREPDVLVRSVEKHTVAKQESKKQNNLADLSPSELRKAFRKTFLSENKHLSAMRDAYATEYDENTTLTTSGAGFTAETNLSEMGSGIRPFEIKISFRDFDSALSRENYTLLTTFAGIVVNDPKRAVQVLIPNDATTDADNRKLTARRLAIVEQVLRDTGVPEQRILPVLSNRDDDGGLVLRNIDSTQYETLTKQQRNQFGKTTSKTYKSMTW